MDQFSSVMVIVLCVYGGKEGQVKAGPLILISPVITMEQRKIIVYGESLGN